MKYDVIVIGGGPSGLMASIGAAKNGASVLLVDKGKKLGRKLAISGGGRCNVTNRMETKDLIAHIPGNGKFMHSPFSIFNNEDIIAFFEGMGISLKEEDMGRMFPVNDKAITVVRTLLNKMKELGVETLTDTPVETIRYSDKKVLGITLQNKESIDANAVIIATGGKSVPHTGSTGDGYPWAKAAGHTITELYPTEVPITSEESFIKEKSLQGLSLQGAELTVYNPKGKPIKSHRGDMIFTHFGVSGPIALRCSQYVVKAFKKFPVDSIEMGISIEPDKNEEDFFQELIKRKKELANKAVKNALRGMAPERLLSFYLHRSEIKESVPLGETNNQDLRRLAQLLHDFRFHVHGTLSIEEAFVTGGGVSIKEIHPKRMESRLKQGLYFCGEVLDIHGYTGGFNITVAFSTGFTAGQSAAEQALEHNQGSSR